MTCRGGLSAATLRSSLRPTGEQTLGARGGVTIGRSALAALSMPGLSRVVGSSSAQLRRRSLAESLVEAFLDNSLACAWQRARSTSSFDCAWRSAFSKRRRSLRAPAAAAGEHGRGGARFPEGSWWRPLCQKKRYAGPRLTVKSAVVAYTAYRLYSRLRLVTGGMLAEAGLLTR